MAAKSIFLIRIHSQGGGSRLHMVGREKFSIGRATEADVVIPSASISRKHLSVELGKDEAIVVEDLGSSNGSFANGARLEPHKKQTVQSSTKVTLGTGGDTVTFHVMERPVEMDDYAPMLPEFNQAIVKESEAMRKQAHEKLQLESRAYVDQSRKELQAEIDQARTAYFDKLQSEITQSRNQSLQKIQDDLQKELILKKEQIAAELREYTTQLKTNAQVEADTLLQKADHDSIKLKQDAAMEFEKSIADSKAKAVQVVNHAEQEALKIVAQARDSADAMRESSRKAAEESVEIGKQKAQHIIQNAIEDSEKALNQAKEQGMLVINHANSESKRVIDAANAESKRVVEAANAESQRVVIAANEESKRVIDVVTADCQIKVESANKESQAFLNTARAAAKEESEKMLQTAIREIETLKIKNADAEKASILLQETLASLQNDKAHLDTSIAALKSELTVLVEKNTRQQQINSHLESLQKDIQAIEMQKAQLLENNEQIQQQMETLRKRTMEELEKTRQAEELKIVNIASSKAKEFADKIEKRILEGMGIKLTLEVSRKISGELTSIFAEESFKHTQAAAEKVTEQGVAPRFFRKKWFQATAAICLIAGTVVLVQHSREAVVEQQKFTEAVVEKRREEMRFAPKMTSQFQKTYSDNVLYMSRYIELKNDSKLQDQWALELNDFFLETLKLSEENMVRFVGLETALIKKLSDLRNSIDARYEEEGILRLREAEKQEMAAILNLLKTESNFKKLRVREKIFLAKALENRDRGPAEASPASLEETKE